MVLIFGQPIQGQVDLKVNVESSSSKDVCVKSLKEIGSVV